MPVWHAATREWVKQGKLVLVGVTQEQHPDRCRLFAQWKGFDWPILHDPITKLGTRVVPIVTAIDEHGVVRSTRPSLRTIERDFIDKEFPAPKKTSKPAQFKQPTREQLAKEMVRAKTPAQIREVADRIVLWDRSFISTAINAYQKLIERDPKDAVAMFRLGVCYRYRYESADRKSDDFQSAIAAWTKALAMNPNQYIWRRRIQQYGPRLIKPYPFYDWVAQAEADIRKRGETPIALKVRPSGAEIARPSRRFTSDETIAKNPDPKNAINRDKTGLVQAEVAVVPAKIRAGQAVRVHIELRPSAKHKTHWSNDAGPTQLWVAAPDGWQIQKRLHSAISKSANQTAEVRRFEFEIKSPATANGVTKIPAFGLYYVCEDKDGTCLYLRRDLKIRVAVGR